MPLRKKNAEPRRQSRQKAGTPKPPRPPLDLAALLKLGNETVIVADEENDNVDFMAELIDTD